MLNHLNHQDSQDQTTPSLNHLIHLENLEGYLEAFLLDRPVNELSPRTIKDYREKIGVFIEHCHSLGVTMPTELDVNYCRLFLLDLQSRYNPVSVRAYYGTVKVCLNWVVVS